jgi:class 3 adenylate cyclase
VQEFATGTRAAAEADQTLATLLFTDIVGSTERAAGLGDRRWLDLLDAHHALGRRLLVQHRGREVKTTGDGFLALFDSPSRAIRCAHQLASDVRELGLEVRASVHTGECEVTPKDVAGLAVHIGARLMGLANGGEVLVSSTVREILAGSSFVFEERGAHSLKGVPGEWRVFLVKPGSSRGR